jgi:acyl-coenzyme A thioesterase PaaI-like protein
MVSEPLQPTTDAMLSESLPDPWSNRIEGTEYGGKPYSEFLETFRDLQDAVAAANPPEEVWTALGRVCRQFVDELGAWAAPERGQPSGTRMDLPGRGDPLLLPFVALESTDTFVRGRVVFRRFHLGGNGAAHGGTLPLLFDEILGHLSNAGGRRTARTAYLKVNYRQITPVGTELFVEARFDRQEGRKRWVTGRLLHGDTLLADAEGLFVELLPGQP